MIPVSEALSLIIAECSSLGIEKVSVSEANGRVLAEEILSPIDFPPFRASVMDGYAVNYIETPNVLQVQMSSRAGEGVLSLQKGYCCYITTGAAVPEGANAVIPIEDIKFIEDKVEIPQCKDQQWIRNIGSDIRKSQILGNLNMVLTPQHISLLASVGITSIKVYKIPLIGYLSTGNELKDIGQELSYGQIIDSNRIMIKFLLSQCKCYTIDYGIVLDNKESVREAIIKASQECDILITSGGVSMGDRDYVKPLLEEEGKVIFGRVDMKPGKPMTFARIGKCLAFALPGNPASCFVCFYLFVRFAIDTITHQALLPTVTVFLDKAYKIDLRPEFHRATVHWDGEHFVAKSTGLQQSSRLLSTVSANCILKFPSSSQGLSEISGFVEGILIGPFQTLKKLSDLDTTAIPEHVEKEKIIIKCGVLSVSDRASKGEYEDKTGPALVEKCTESWGGEVFYRLVSDDKELIKSLLISMSDACDVVFTTGGTGFSPRDVTPDATKEVIDKETPGLVTKMLMDGLKNTEYACLSRMVAGIRKKTLIINFPGSMGGVNDCFLSIKSIIPHAVSLIKS